MCARATRAVFTVLALCPFGCAHFGEAFDERIGQNLDGSFRRVSLRCELTEAEPRAPGAHLSIEGASGPSDRRQLLTPFAVVPESASCELVGEVFGQGSGMTRWSSPFPLGVEGPPLGAQLTEAVRERLARDGIALAEAGPPEAPRLALTLRRVWVHSLSGGFFELRGHLVADVEWRAVLLAPDGEHALWTHEFARHAKRRIAYAYARDHEALLREAWCGSLDDFAAVAVDELAPLLAVAH